MNAVATAKERQLDWLLDEVLGEGRRTYVATTHSRWVTAALIVLAVSVAFGVAWLRRSDAMEPAQEPAPKIPWLEVHGPSALAAAPLDAVALRCFDFDDDALRALPKFTKLEHLDLSGMDVNDRGYSVALKISDIGVTHLGKLEKLRSLSLARCEQMKGTSLHVLEALPLLETLDLTYSGVESEAIERLPRLASLRELTLSHCMKFHGQSLAEVAKIPGLRKLELQGCTTISAKDALHLANAKGLRWLDLRDCQGRFRGQRMSVATDMDVVAPPTEDGIGITDDVVVAIASLPLEVLRLGGSESLTDAIGPSLAKMTTLRTLDLAFLPHLTDRALADLPADLVSLTLDENFQLGPAALARLPALPRLRHLGVSGMAAMDGAALQKLLENKQLESLAIGGHTFRSWGLDPKKARVSALRPRDIAVVVAQNRLQRLDLANAEWLDADAVRQLRRLPELRSLDLSRLQGVVRNGFASLGEIASLRTLRLAYCDNLDPKLLTAFAKVPLEELDLYATGLFPAHVKSAAAAWPGCLVTMPDGAKWRVPAK